LSQQANLDGACRWRIFTGIIQQVEQSLTQ